MESFESICTCGNCLECNSKKKCITTIKQRIEASTPIKLEVIAGVKNTRIECGEPKICSYSKPNYCHNKNNCEFMIKQILNVEIPISYCVKADLGDSYIECNNKLS